MQDALDTIDCRFENFENNFCSDCIGYLGFGCSLCTPSQNKLFHVLSGISRSRVLMQQSQVVI